MKKIFLLMVLAPCLVNAQISGAVQVARQASVQDLQANLYTLASARMQGRYTGSHGDTLAAEYIAGWFKKYHLEAPYQNGKSYIQPVVLNRLTLTQSEIGSNGKRHHEFDDWYIFINNTYNTRLHDSLPVVFAGYGITSGAYNDLAGVDVSGKAVIVMEAEPRDNIADLLASAGRSTISADYLKNLTERGAAAVLVATAGFERAAGALRRAGNARAYRSATGTANSIPRIYISEKMTNDLLAQNDITLQSLKKNIQNRRHPLSLDTKSKIHISLQIDSMQQKAPNVIGIIRGKDTAAGTVIMSAHHDHLGMQGNTIYYGAADNASGTATLMELAKLAQHAVQKGMRPKRTIVFASFTGEELGLRGAYYFTAHPVVPVENIWAAYNIDMLGRVDTFYSGKLADSNYVYYLLRDSLGHGLNDALVHANASIGLKLDDRYQQSESSYRRLTGSDQYPFYRLGIPVIRTDCGFAREYHQPTDTPDKINYPLLTRQTQLAFLTLWNIANE